jgi:DNA-binding response OmpR family regulator
MESPAMAGSRARILCVEDDRETAALIAEDLADRGYDASCAFDGQEGLAAFLRTRPDLVLCDISLPVMSGFELLEVLLGIWPSVGQVPFIFLTALADRDAELRGRRLGADDYLTKPIDFEILATVVTARLSPLARHEVWRQSVALTEREIEVLTHAARGRTSAEIGRALDLAQRTVDFHIDNARAKLGASTRVEAAIKAATGGLIRP